MKVNLIGSLKLLRPYQYWAKVKEAAVRIGLIDMNYSLDDELQQRDRLDAQAANNEPHCPGTSLHDSLVAGERVECGI